MERYIAIALTFLFALSPLGPLGCTKRTEHPAPPVSGDKVKFETASMEVDKPYFYSYAHEGKVISFFVIKHTDGHISSHFDACRKCYAKKLGYEHKDKKLSCKACEETFKASELESGRGSCLPLPLEGKLEAGWYVIDTAKLIEKAGLF